jgi:hypothetical protein
MPQPAKPDNRLFRDYPLTGHGANMPKSSRTDPYATSTPPPAVDLGPECRSTCANWIPFNILRTFLGYEQRLSDDEA